MNKRKENLLNLSFELFEGSAFYSEVAGMNKFSA